MARKSFDEEMAAALRNVQRAQKRVAALKAKKEKQDKMKKEKIGDAVAKCFPKILDLMDDKEFDINEFVKTPDFARAFHFRFVQPDDRKIPSWTKTKEEEENQIETEEPEPELVPETEEVEETNTVNSETDYKGYSQYI